MSPQTRNILGSRSLDGRHYDDNEREEKDVQNRGLNYNLEDGDHGNLLLDTGYRPAFPKCPSK